MASRIGELNAQELANTIHAFAKLRHVAGAAGASAKLGQVFGPALRRILPQRIGGFSARNIANTAWARLSPSPAAPQATGSAR